MHAPNYWKWFCAPGVVYIIEVLIRVKNSFGSHGYTYIQEGTVLASRVIHLVIKRPASFEFRPGDWIFVQIPEIATAEWHPFTISSAPEMSDVVWLHVRAVGEWTNRVLEYFIEQERVIQHRNRLLSFSGFDYERTFVNGPCNASAKDAATGSRLAFASVIPGNRHERLFDCSIKMDLNDTSHSGCPNGVLMNCSENALVQPILLPLASKCKYVESNEGCISYKGPAIRRSLSKLYLLPRSEHCGQAIGKHNPTFNCDVEAGENGVEQMRQRSASVCDMSPISLTRQMMLSHADVNRNQVATRIKLDRPLHIHMDGPYGSATSHIFSAQHAVLIATGIGVTPFASILQSIMFRYKNSKHVCPTCEHAWTDPAPQMSQLRKVDFVWINRDQKSFEWFIGLLSELESTQAQLRERFLDIHMYVTSAVGLQFALDLMHKKEQRDLITGLKTKTQPGRPKWNEVGEVY